MSKPIIPSDQIPELYTEFNDLYKEIMEKPFLDLKPKIDAIWKMFEPKGQALQNADFSSSTLFDKAKVVRDIGAKLKSVEAKLFPKKKTSTSSSPVLEGCVGYRNQSNNCWLNAVLQMCQQRPHLWDTVHRVGAFCQSGGNIDRHHMEQVLQAFETGVPQNLTQVLKEYNQIRHLIYKLNVLHQLKKKEVDPTVLMRFPFPIDAYRERIREKMQRTLTLAGGIATQKTADIWAEMAIEEIVQEDLIPSIEQMKIDGGFLLQALEAYEEGCKLGQSIPTSVSQNAREAFYRLFMNYTTKGKAVHPIALEASHNEDSHEVIDNLMLYDQSISIFQGSTITPQGYFSCKTTKIFTPLQIVPSVNLSGKSTLQHNSFITKSTLEHEIQLNLPVGGELSLEGLLKDLARHKESHEATYINPEGRLQNYLCTESRMQVQEAPEQLTFQLVRFNERMEKVRTPVRIHRYMILPAEILTSSQIVVYQLESFIVHTGASRSTGHYIAYRLVNRKWVECDDNQLRSKTDAQVDKILPQSYLVYYSKVPDNEQEAALQVAKSLAQTAPGATKVDDTTIHNQEALVTRLETLVELLKRKDTTKFREAYESFIKEYPACAQRMHSLVELLLGISAKQCAEDPTHLQAHIAGESIPANALKYEILVLRRLLVEQNLEGFKRFSLHLFSTEKNFENVFSALPLELQNVIKKVVAPGEEHAFEGALKHETLREFILTRLNKERNLSIIERALERQIHDINLEMDIQHLEDYLVVLRTPRLKKELLSNLLHSFNLMEATYDQLLNGINMRRSGKLMQNLTDRELNVLSLSTNPTILSQPRWQMGKTVPRATPSILEYAIVNLRK